MWQSNDIIRRKQVETFCVKQSDTLKYIARVLGGAVSKNIDNTIFTTALRTWYTRVPRTRVLGGAVSKRYIRFHESRNHLYVITTSSRAQAVTAEAA